MTDTPRLHRRTAVRPSTDVIFRELEGEGVLLDLASGRYFGLNAIGTRVWTFLAAGATIDDAIAAIAAECDADGEQVERDIDDFLEALAARGLLVSAPPEP